MMKKLNILLIAITALFFSACSQLSNTKDKDISAQTGDLCKFTLDLKSSTNARTLNAVDISKDVEYDITEIVFKQGNQTVEPIVEEVNEYTSWYLPAGEYDIELKAIATFYDGQDITAELKVYGKKSFTLEIGAVNIIQIPLVIEHSGNGDLKLDVSINKDFFYDYLSLPLYDKFDENGSCTVEPADSGFCVTLKSLATEEKIISLDFLEIWAENEDESDFPYDLKLHISNAEPIPAGFYELEISSTISNNDLGKLITANFVLKDNLVEILDGVINSQTIELPLYEPITEENEIPKSYRDISINLKINEDQLDIFNNLDFNNVSFSVSCEDITTGTVIPSEDLQLEAGETEYEYTFEQQTVGNDILIKAEIQCDGRIYFAGSSGIVLVEDELEVIDIELTSDFTGAQINIDFAKPIELRIGNNGYYSYTNEVDYSDEIEIVAFQGENQVTFENKNVVWTINGHSIPTDGSEVYGCRFAIAKNDNIYKNRLSINAPKLFSTLDSDRYLVKLLVSDNNKSASAYIDFTYIYAAPTVEGTDINTPFVLYDSCLYIGDDISSIDYESPVQDANGILWPSNFMLSNGSKVYYTKSSNSIYSYPNKELEFESSGSSYVDVNSGIVYYMYFDKNADICKLKNSNGDEFVSPFDSGTKFAITNRYAAT